MTSEKDIKEANQRIEELEGIHKTYQGAPHPCCRCEACSYWYPLDFQSQARIQELEAEIESQAAQITALTEANVKMSHQIDALLERQEELVCEVRIDQAQIKKLR